MQGHNTSQKIGQTEKATLGGTIGKKSGQAGYRADEYNQLPDELVVSMESKEHKKMEDLAGIQTQHHEQQLRKELSMVAQVNDAKHGDVNS